MTKLLLSGLPHRLKLATALMLAHFLFGLAIQAQTPNFLWAIQGAGNGYNEANAIACDPDGNLLVAGSIFSTSVSLDGVTLTNGAQPLVFSGGITSSRSAVFFAKFDPAGKLLWTRQAGNLDGGRSEACAVDAAGNLFVTGRISTTNFTLGGNLFINAGVENMFVAKISPAGNVLWARQGGGSGHDFGNSIAVDGSGNVYVGGTLGSSNAVFGSFQLSNSQTTPNAVDAFLSKYTSSGDLLWVKQIKRASDYASLAIAADPSGLCYVTGNFFTVADFGGLALVNSTESSNLVFIAKYDSSGNPLWARATGNGADSFTASMAIAPDGGAYLAGSFQSSPTISFDSTILTNNGAESIFLIKYDAAGNLVWANGVLGSATGAYDSASAVTTDAAGNVYLAGALQSTNANFGGITLTNFYSMLEYDVGFVAKYDNAGHAVWVKAMTGGIQFSNVNPEAIAADQCGNVCLAGNFLLDTNSDSIILTPASQDLFVAKINGPQVSLKTSGSQATISWPVSATGLGLEYTTDLHTSAWQPVTITPVVVGTQNTVTLSLSGSSQFFRLHNH